MSLLSRLAVGAARAYGSLAISNRVSADFLVVAGGGGGGQGGGGAGGFRTSAGTSGGGASAENAITLSTLNTYSIIVGAGGGSATNGSNSSLSGTGLTTITSTGGGTGGIFSGSVNGSTGGSGGGGQYAGTGGAGTANQGYAGGAGGGASVNYPSGGGGGAGAVGQTPASSSANGGNGGAGVASSISGSSVTYAGGGGGGSDGTAGNGGVGGGANGTVSTLPTAATANTGGGGGGRNNSSPAGAGGSGIVIISYTSATPKFVGGTITTSGGKQIHTFTSSGTLSPITPITASYLVVAGGGGGGSGDGNGGGGGGGGGYQASSTTLYSGATYVVTVGAGGSGGSNPSSGSQGSNSIVSGTGLTTITSTGGGAGADGQSNGGNGGSGGGGGGGVATTGGTGTSGQGNNGGAGVVGGSLARPGGGGGGASAVGANGGSSPNYNGGNGGNGTASSISGTSVTYAGGGGAGTGTSSTSAGTGGTGGGGDGTKGLTTGGSGTPNTGGGGGGSGTTDGNNGGNGGAGGSGIVIISYAGSQQFNGGLVTTSGGNTIHTFTSSGALTPLTNNLTNSLRFRSSASAYLNRTPTVAGNTQKWTWSAWIKLGKLSTFSGLFGALNGTDRMYIGYGSAAKWQIYGTNAGTDYVEAYSTGLYRDPSAWYHLVIAVDTTQATAGNRLKMYVNGNQESVSFTTNMTLNANTSINKAIATVIGETSVGNDPFDGYMTDINFIDGQQLEPYYFGNNDANGVWKPILYKGTYGTNGFYLTFGNTTSTTTLGYDSSPNGNNWTCNNISLTAGTTYDAMKDVPTNTSATVANYCVMNPLNKLSAATTSNGNLNVQTSGSSGATINGTFGVSSGKWYWETILNAATDATIFGIDEITELPSYPGVTTTSYSYYPVSALKINNAVQTSYGVTATTNDVIGCALDMDNGKIWWSKNGTWMASGDPVAGTNAAFTGITGTKTPAVGDGSSSSNVNVEYNFGQRPFAYTPPTGFVALNTYNLPTPTILQGNRYMDATLYTGTNVSNTIVNQGQFKPDLVWIKSRSVTGANGFTDSVRGRAFPSFSNSTDAEGTSASDKDLISFNSNGFTVGIGNQYNSNGSGNTLVGWQWQAGQGSTSSNTSGTITSTTSVSTTAGFSVVTYAGNSTSSATVGHGLGVSPSMVIIKNRSSVTNWVVRHSSLSSTQNVSLNTTDAAYTVSSGTANGGVGAFTSTTFGFISGTTGLLASNQTSNNYVAYCWAEIAGFSKFGSYTGNGSTDGPFIFLGFRPKFIITKRTDSATGSNWEIHDSSRNTYNVANLALYPNTIDAEGSQDDMDFLSNGFKLRYASANTQTNTNGGTFIYAAFAEHPFKNSNAR